MSLEVPPPHDVSGTSRAPIVECRPYIRCDVEQNNVSGIAEQRKRNSKYPPATQRTRVTNKTETLAGLIGYSQ